EAGAGIEPANSGFADRDLTTWLPRHCARRETIECRQALSTRGDLTIQRFAESGYREGMTKSRDLFARARRRIPGGVNSPVRGFRAVGGEPVFVGRAKGSRSGNVDDVELIDYVGSWGPAILGHAPPVVVSAIRDAAQRGVSFGIPNPLEVEMAELICAWMPAIEKVRMVNSGTEATMSCLRLARGFTKRDKIVKFAGCYHGHADSLLVKAGSGALTHGQPDSAVFRGQSPAKQLFFLSTIPKRSVPPFAKTRTRSPESFSNRFQQTSDYFFHAKVSLINFGKNARETALS